MSKCIPALRGYSWEREKGKTVVEWGAQKTQECVYPEVSESSSESTFPIKRYTGQTVAATKTRAQDTPRLPLFRATEPGGALKAVISESIDRVAAFAESQAPSANQARGAGGEQQLGLGSWETGDMQNSPLRAAPRLR